jgi:hypothetical protein
MSEIDQKAARHRPSSPTAGSTSLAARLRRYFLTGLVVAGPVAITAWLIWSIVTW